MEQGLVNVAARAGFMLDAGLLAEVAPVFIRLCEQGEEVVAAVQRLGLTPKP